MELLDFIHEHDNWRDLIQEAPYCIKIKEDDKYLLLKYNYYADETDWANPIVKQCRGIILRKDNLQPVCVPFYRFYNLGQKEADEIDWSNCKIQDKIDGSLIKIWIDDEELHISTNGSINAFDVQLATLSGTKSDTTFGDLVNCFIKDKKELFYKYKNSTHMFELISPFNKVVINYPKIDLIYLGSRDNNNFKEYFCEELVYNFSTPKRYDLNAINEYTLRSLAEKCAEGIVVVDNNYNRVKVKNPKYLLLSKTIESIKQETLLEIIGLKDEGEFLATIQDENIKKVFLNLKNKVDSLSVQIERYRKELQERNFQSQKERAIYIQKYCPKWTHTFLYKNIDFYKFTADNPKKILKIIKLLS